MSAKDYRDPLYGFISITPLEQRLIDTHGFQRLRNIRQLATSFLIYPTAMHTRFEHSLGTLAVADQMLHALFSKAETVEILEQTLGWDGTDRAKAFQILRLAALLHDLGHPPFSHAAESLLPEENGHTKDHEDFTYRLIMETEIADIVDTELGSGSAEQVAEIAVNRATKMDRAFLSELLTGDFGADRIDYLMRDSYHLGVQYGRFDVHRLLNTLLVRLNEDKQGPELAVEDGGLHAVEAFILARYFMFLDVYFHKTRRILDHHLVQFLVEILEGGCYPEDLNAYLEWDDHRVMHLLQTRQDLDPARRIKERGHYRLAFETADHPEFHELVQFKWLRSEVQKTFGPDIVFDEAKKATYTFDQPEVFVLDKKIREYRPLSQRSSLVRSLKRIDKHRVYALPEKRDAVTAFCKRSWEESTVAEGGG